MAKKSNKNLVSVIICFLDAKKFLREAIESVFAQTYNNWELLLIDDGSTDGSSDIAHRYAEQHPQKVIYLDHDNHENRGLSASRNLGIKKSKGEYIAPLDSDDVWLPQKLEEQIQIMNSYPEVAMVYGPAHYWYSWTDKPKSAKDDYLQKLNVKTDAVIKPPALLKKFLKDVNITPCPSCILVRHKIAHSVGGFEESAPNVCEDQAFYVKITLESSIFAASQCWLKYRIHSGSLWSMTQKSGEYFLCRQRLWKWIIQYLVNKGVKDKEIWSTIEDQLQKLRSSLE
ncbi:MAG: glycosyltransferase family 2 protein [Deltaproteobacteria bacterium]|nr:glycosyltransferase family 2 protein [Deltaproteobacteria bacterium]